jgi:aquaporin Z
MMKRYAMEFIGTFFLTVAISLIANPIAIGLVLMAVIYVGGHISGAHFNPAISFACFFQNRLNLASFAKYAAAQTAGALLALCFFGMITNGSFTLDIVPGSPILAPMSLEALFVLLFAWVYLTMNLMNRYKDTAVPGVVIGLTLLAIASAGGLYNPAVALASLICNVVRDGGIAMGMGCVMVHIVGPLFGAFCASFVFDYFKSESQQ